MTGDMLTRPGPELPEDIRDTSGDVPIISSWATVDFVANGMGDLGFFTQSNSRRKSLGTIAAAAAAAIEHGLNNGLSQVNWTCDAENVGSYSTAKKLGLEKIGDYKMVLLLMDEERHRKLVEELG
jgi:RimJ/RimL family protein N-acetyltransferase